MTHDKRCPLLLMALLWGGCERYPEQPVFVYGRALRGPDTPLREARLRCDRREETGALPTETEHAPTFTPYGEVITQGDGTFTLELPAGDVEEVVSAEQHRYSFRLSTPLDGKGQAALVSFTFNAQDVELPPLNHWDANLSVENGASGPVVTFASAPAALEQPPGAKLPVFDPSEPTPPTPPQSVLQLLSGGAVFWEELAGGSPWSPPAWVLEDFAMPEAQIRALSLGEWWFEPLWGGTSRVTFRLEWRSARQRFQSGALLPLSRGASCQPWWEGGACPWTDGQLASVPLGDTPDPTEVGVVLAAPSLPSRAVIRGLRGERGAFVGPTRLILEGSLDGATWHALARKTLSVPWRLNPEEPFAVQGLAWAADSDLDGPLALRGAPLFLDVDLASSAPVRYVRLYALNSLGERKVLHSLAELSLFE